MKRPIALLFDYEVEPISIPLPSPYPKKDIHMVSYAYLGLKGKIKAKLAVNKSMPEYSKKAGLDKFHKSITKTKPKYIVAHNLIAFDRHILESHADLSEVKFLDTLIISRRLFTERAAHGLGSWGQTLGFSKDDYSPKVRASIRKQGLEYNNGDEFKRKHVVENFDHCARYCLRDTNLMGRVLLEAVIRITGKNVKRISDITEKHLDMLYEYTNLENKVQKIMFDSQQKGYPLDIKRLVKAGAEIKDGLDAITKELEDATGSGWIKTEAYTPTRKSARAGVVNYAWEYRTASPYAVKHGRTIKIRGVHYLLDKEGNRIKREAAGISMFPRCELKWSGFNPNSKKQVSELLMKEGWKPIAFTPGGQPKCGVKDLKPVETLYPIAKTLNEYAVLSKQYSSVINGAKSLVNSYNETTRCIHHLNNIAGASASSRSTHIPNVSQVTKAKFNKDTGEIIYGRGSKWGSDMRSSFMPFTGHTQVGADLSGIELRTVANMLYKYDKGRLIEVILQSDIHNQNTETILEFISLWAKSKGKKSQKSLKKGLLKVYDRDSSKKSLYTFMYGGGNAKIGHDACPWLDDDLKYELGQTIRNALLTSLRGLSELLADHKVTVGNTGTVTIFDGSVFSCLDDYLILSRINQSTGSRVALNWVYDSHKAIEKYAKKHDLVMWEDICLLGYFHDEVQYSVVSKHAKKIGKLLTKQSLKTGKRLGFKIPIESEYKLGNNWAECH